MPIRLWLKKNRFRLLALLLVALVLPTLVVRLASPWRCVGFYSLQGSVRDVAESSPEFLRIASYNIAHGRGLAVSNHDGGGSAERLRRLGQIAELLREINADVVVLNEVDFNTSWSYSLNQARFLAEQAGYPFVAEQRNLDLRVLNWTWRFGNAILSRYPIENAELLDLPGTVAWETVLAGKKRGLVCDIRVGGDMLRVVGVHFCHRSESIRVHSARTLLTSIAGSRYPVIVAGDLNSTPTGFPKSVVDENGVNAMDTLDASGILRRSVENPPANADGFTFASNKPVSVIDWILIPRAWRFVNYQVHDSVLSDHRLIFADIRRGEK